MGRWRKHWEKLGEVLRERAPGEPPIKPFVYESIKRFALHRLHRDLLRAAQAKGRATFRAMLRAVLT
jgi:hypothetical protein